MHIAEIDTPAILVDVDVMERNLRRVADYSGKHNFRLRPHTKTHKTVELARLQLALGAAGLTVAKTTEAEMLLGAAPSDLLVAYPVIGAAKLARLTALAARTNVTVAVDSLCAARGISEAAASANVTVGVLAEIDAGLHRVGVAPGPELLALVRDLSRLPAIQFRGLAFYPGHIKSVDSGVEAKMSELDAFVRSAVELCESDGHAVEIVSGGSTPTLFYSHLVSRMNEIRPGTYIFNDRNTWKTNACAFEDCAASILATVVSTAVPGQMIIDGGSKTFSSDRCAAPEAEGFGYFPEAPGAILEKMNEEHGFVRTSPEDRAFRIGERVRVIPNHICTAVNLHERIYGVRGDEVVETWTVAARGKLQ